MAKIKLCPECGMNETEWPNPQGIKKDDRIYCCEGCAAKTGCICK